MWQTEGHVWVSVQATTQPSFAEFYLIGKLNEFFYNEHIYLIKLQEYFG